MSMYECYVNFCCFVLVGDCVCVYNSNGLDEPIGFSGSPPFSVFNNVFRIMFVVNKM